jgi:hypothetical protein
VPIEQFTGSSMRGGKKLEIFDLTKGIVHKILKQEISFLKEIN